MKILAQAMPGNTFSGFRLAAEAAGHTWRWWDERHEATFDVFDELDPDVVFFMDPTRPLAKCMKENDTAMVQGCWHKPFTFQANAANLPFGRLVDKQIFNIAPPPPFLANNPVYVCDVGITASSHPIGINLCYEQFGKLNIKIMCEESWGVIQYLGVGSLENKRDLYRSSTLVLVDSLLEAMRVAACGSVPVNIGEKFSDKEFSERCLEAENTEDVLRFLNNTKCQQVSRRNLDSCIAGHTYDDALKAILKETKP